MVGTRAPGPARPGPVATLESEVQCGNMKCTSEMQRPLQRPLPIPP
jgi:hypothetical protein